MSSKQQKDTRDIETKFRQDLGLLEWQIRDLMPIIENHYSSAKDTSSGTSAISLSDEELERIIDEFFNDDLLLVCDRVWEAWHIGTMRQDDFHPIYDDEYVLPELKEKIIEYLHTVILEAKLSLAQEIVQAGRTAALIGKYSSGEDKHSYDLDNETIGKYARKKFLDLAAEEESNKENK